MGVEQQSEEQSLHAKRTRAQRDEEILAMEEHSRHQPPGIEPPPELPPAPPRKALMLVGVATANSILMVSFAREQLDEGIPAFKAAVAAGYTRIRPVLMTALAMIIGMVPMALGFGEGGEQNAPLGRAVIGGLLFATVATLFFVPSVFAIFHGRREARRAREQEQA